MFRKKSGGNASEEDMRQEFRRVNDLPRTAGNLRSDYQCKSPLKMDREMMLRDLREKMLSYWGQKGQSFPNLNTLPPMTGPFKPPPSVSGGTTTLNTIHRQLAGRWAIGIGDWHGFFFFDANGGVSWAESDYSRKHAGRWSVSGSRLEWKFRDPGDFRTFTISLPLNTTEASGTILPAGQGWFTMRKPDTGCA